MVFGLYSMSSLCFYVRDIRGILLAFSLHLCVPMSRICPGIVGLERVNSGEYTSIGSISRV